jgi:FkbM family methyltransferase
VSLTARTRLKTVIARVANCAIDLLGTTAAGRYALDRFLVGALGRVQQVEHGGCTMTFAVANTLCKFRVDTFSTKEPETLEWIDGIPREAVLWDIGANVGLYACYAAKARGCRVFAFEPSVFNLELLARNIFLNQLTGLITIVPLALAEQLAFSTLRMTTTGWGGALSTFGQPYGHDGKPIRKVFEFPTVGLSMVDAVTLLKVPQPDFIKIDVDGIEHLILKGGGSVLLQAKSILVEINDQFTAQAGEAGEILRTAGFVLKEKRHAESFDYMSGAAHHTFNQIWARPT